MQLPPASSVPVDLHEPVGGREAPGRSAVAVQAEVAVAAIVGNRQAARAVLPNATETKIFATANVRAWRHFIEMRGASFADWEIRILAIKVLKLLQCEAPLLFGDFRIEDMPDGTQIATPEFSKV